MSSVYIIKIEYNEASHAFFLKKKFNSIHSMPEVWKPQNMDMDI